MFSVKPGTGHAKRFTTEEEDPIVLLSTERSPLSFFERGRIGDHPCMHGGAECVRTVRPSIMKAMKVRPRQRRLRHMKSIQ